MSALVPVSTAVAYRKSRVLRSRKMSDLLARGILRDQNLRVCVAVTTALTQDAAARHGLAIGAACALGRSLTSGLLLATLSKSGERVTLQIVGSGPIGAVVVDASEAGQVRGYVKHPEAGATLPKGRVRLEPLLGRSGYVNVVRDLGLKENYQGQVPLITGEVDEDVESYLRTSEQVPSALGCEVVLSDDGGIAASAGILVQALPDGDAAYVREMQHALRTGALDELLSKGTVSARAIGSALVPGLDFLGDDQPLEFRCRCAAERIIDMLRLLTIDDLDEMIAEGKPAEVTCNFCNALYQIGTPELERIREEAKTAVRERN